MMVRGTRAEEDTCGDLLVERLFFFLNLSTWTTHFFVFRSWVLEGDYLRECRMWRANMDFVIRTIDGFFSSNTLH